MISNFKRLISMATTAVALSLTAHAAAMADELQTLKSTGELRIAMSGQYPPFSFANDKNEIVGFDASIGSELANRLKLKPVIVTAPFDGIIGGLLAKKYDIVVASMTITPAREKAVDFVGPYYHVERVAVVSANSPIQKIDQLKGKTVGVILGDTNDKWAQAQDGWTVRTYKGLPEMLMELQSGRIDAIVMDSVPVMVAVKETGQKVRMLTITNAQAAPDSIGIAVRKGNPELKVALQKALDDMKADGSYEKISRKWIGSDIR
ncbi:transporter substrate-binding domain-containing protein [Paraburkholderia sacchari]|uniref:transporter substrate-binding domain-containing protein n=1 Tax=Paraburkholderia sacchari TaxID=159450 RepID=UPI001BD1B53E|nr:transporter substrate-binding domain-containing protein [Paraburkholderia sacchari]